MHIKTAGKYCFRTKPSRKRPMVVTSMRMYGVLGRGQFLLVSVQGAGLLKSNLSSAELLTAA